MDFFERGGGARFYFFFSKTFFDPLFYYPSECNSSFGLVHKSFILFCRISPLRNPTNSVCKKYHSIRLRKLWWTFIPTTLALFVDLVVWIGNLFAQWFHINCDGRLFYSLSSTPLSFFNTLIRCV